MNIDTTFQSIIQGFKMFFNSTLLSRRDESTANLAINYSVTCLGYYLLWLVSFYIFGQIFRSLILIVRFGFRNFANNVNVTRNITMNFVDELKWRGMIHDIMPGTKEQLDKELTAAYVGIDPTADSLHIGHLVGVMMLKHFQIAGHKPIALVGGATGMIGDPSGKSQERNLLDESTLRYNQECLKKQLAKFLDFESQAPNAAEMVNNYDWMKNSAFWISSGTSASTLQ